MSFEKFLFYMFAVILLGAAVMVVTRRNPVHSALFLVLVFFNMAGIWILAEAEFLAIALVLVYVGAVMVLFLFVIMMLDIDLATVRAGFVRHLPLGLLVSALMFMEMALVLGPKHFGLARYAAPEAAPADYNNTAELGLSLFTRHLYALEIAAVILLVAMIAAISLTLRKRPGTKRQNITEQHMVRKKDRLKIVKMAAEEKG
ncbi:NADH-quinone oxidoreductase subunit J [Thiolapillus brandeum]|uniref:NADH-quinone oxidoreductase subunit J n=1 Tax=Thiolapillus brandeum TaxID=1076588 RepID=A0A7U6GI93_9GAMM|nr:NADH-quinone oxidoreductase subunit J [Thiolapillus brandeum]BAO44148.1 NADH dehydrogenase I subunit J [Thiolapillus brandeum]